MLLLTGIVGYLGTLMVVCVYFIVLLTFIITVCWILELVELLFLVLVVPFFFGPFRVCCFLLVGIFGGVDSSVGDMVCMWYPCQGEF